MKKIITLSLALLMLATLASACAAPRVRRMQVTITPTCYDHNHVGDDWYQYYELNGYEMLDGDLIDFTYGPDNSYWHTPQDTMDKISEESLLKSGRLVAEFINIVL